MARTVITLQETTRDGITPTYAAGDSVNDQSFDNAGQDVVIHIKNGAVACVATFVTPGLVDGEPVADKIVTVTATEERIIGPFRNDLYGQADSLNSIAKAVFIDLDDATNVTIAAFKIGTVDY